MIAHVAFKISTKSVAKFINLQVAFGVVIKFKRNARLVFVPNKTQIRNAPTIKCRLGRNNGRQFFLFILEETTCAVSCKRLSLVWAKQADTTNNDTNKRKAVFMVFVKTKPFLEKPGGNKNLPAPQSPPQFPQEYP